MSDERAALWYWQHGSLYARVYDDEESAASSGVYMMDDGSGSPVGCQRSDGTFLPCDEWPAYKAEDDRQMQAFREAVAEYLAKPRPATRPIRAPFDGGHEITVLASEPDWLGAALLPSPTPGDPT